MRSVTSVLVVAMAWVLLPACESDAPPQQVTTGDDTAEATEQDAVATGTLSGLVTGGDSVGVPGAEITTEPPAGAAISKADGGWRIAGVPSGVYTVIVARSGYAPATKAGVTVQGGGTTLVDFLLFPDATETDTGAIDGTVRDEAGAPVGGASLELGTGALQTVTAPDGAFAFLAVPPGVVSLSVSKDGFQPLTVQLTVVANESLTPALTLIALPDAGRLQGTLTQGGLGLPIAGAAISTTPASGETTTGGDGGWSLDGLSEGAYVVHAVMGGFQGAVSEAVVVQAGQTTTVDMTMDPQLAEDSTCTGCHVTKTRILMDLEDDPLPVPSGESGSAGEG